MDEDGRAAVFARMAMRIGQIDPLEFAGAAVIVPKDGDPIVFLLQDPSPKQGQFWLGLQSRVEIAVAEARSTEEQATGPFAMRR